MIAVILVVRTLKFFFLLDVCCLLPLTSIYSCSSLLFLSYWSLLTQDLRSVLLHHLSGNFLPVSGILRVHSQIAAWEIIEVIQVLRIATALLGRLSFWDGLD